MKTKLLAVATLTALILAAACIWQQRQLRSAEAQLSRMHGELLAETQARVDQERRSKAFEQRQAGLSEQVMALSGLVAQLRGAEATSASNSVRGVKPAKILKTEQGDAEEAGLFGGKGFGAMFSKMMKDPAMKEMMRSQQRTMVNKMYGPLFKDLNLSGEQKEKFMQLLLDQQMSSMDKADTFFDSDGKFDPAKIAEATKAQETQGTEEIKALLGDDQFAYYQDYKKTMGDRMQLEQLKDQLDGTKSALKDNQMKDLLLLIADERSKNPSLISEDSPTSAADLEKMFSADGFEKQLQSQEEMNQRVIARAGPILNQEQLQAYADFQKQQLNMQRLGMTMAREMFGKKSNAGAGEKQIQIDIIPSIQP
jgi:hypothetical protein